MRLLFVADLHYSLKQFDWLLTQAAGYDLVIIGGDLLDLSSALDPDVQITIVENYLRKLRALAPLVICSGNHDGDSSNAADESVAEWVRAARGDGVYVDGDGFTLGGLRVTVCPWWDGDVTRQELEELLAREAEHARAARDWLWVHHAPPDGSKTSWARKKALGDTQLRAWIERFQPGLVLSGHIHNSPFYEEGSWVDRIGRTWVFNPGRQIGSEPSHILLDFNEQTAEWRSLAGASVQDLGVAQA